jgi:hypothetical protein
MHAPATVPDSADDGLLAVVADIRARLGDVDLPVPAADAIAAVSAHLQDEVPMDAAGLAEHERQWHAVEDELQAVERADAQRDGLNS